METFAPGNNIDGLVIPQFILDKPTAGIGAKILYALLCKYAADEGTDHCQPTHATLAKNLSCGVTSVKKYLAQLTALNLICVKYEEYRACVYYLLRPDSLEDKPEDSDPQKPKTGSRQAEADRHQPESGYINTLKQEEENTYPPLPPASRKLPPAAKPVGEGFSVQDFEKAWVSYPKKDAKGHALYAWKQLAHNGQLPSLAEILAAIGRFMLTEQWQREHGRYIPQFSNFLRGQRWLDPLSPDEELAEQQRLQAARATLAAKHAQEANDARNNAHLERLRPIYDAFTEKFGEEARQFHEGAAAMHFGKWRFLHGRYGGPTAADVPEGNTLTIQNFMNAYQRRREAEAYREAQGARDSQTDKRERKPMTSAAQPQNSNFLSRLFPAAHLCAAV